MVIFFDETYSNSNNYNLLNNYIIKENYLHCGAQIICLYNIFQKYFLFKNILKYFFKKYMYFSYYYIKIIKNTKKNYQFNIF